MPRKLKGARKGSRPSAATKSAPTPRLESSWKKRRQHGTIRLSRSLKAADVRSTKRALTDFWRTLLTAIEHHCVPDWRDAIYCEVWADSGRVIAYPNNRLPSNGLLMHERDEPVSVDIQMPLLQNKFNALPDESEVGRRKTEKAGADLRRLVLDMLVDAAMAPRAIRQFKDLHAQHAFSVFAFEYHGEEGVFKLHIHPRRKNAFTRLSRRQTGRGATSPKTEEEAIAELERYRTCPAISIAERSKRGVVGINLSDSEVGNADLVHLALMPNVKELRLGDTKIGNKGLAYLEPLTKLRYLSLFNTNVSDAGLVHLRGMENLSYLNVCLTKVTAKGVSSLMKALPKLKKVDH